MSDTDLASFYGQQFGSLFFRHYHRLHQTMIDQPGVLNPTPDEASGPTLEIMRNFLIDPGFIL